MMIRIKTGNHEVIREGNFKTADEVLKILKDAERTANSR